MKQVRPIIWGVAIVALGVIFGGNAIGLFNFNVFFDGWWTLFIIVPGVVSLITEREKLSSLGFISAGVLMLLASQNVITWDVAWKSILAVFLILIGLSIIFKSIFHSKNDKEVAKKVKDAENDKTMDSQTAVFSGNERTYNGEPFNGSNVVAIFGGAELDLRNAKFTKDTVIKAFCLFGGIDIKVPEDVQIISRSGFIFGGISDERRGEAEKGKYTIYLDATGGFGGVEISDKTKKNKK